MHTLFTMIPMESWFDVADRLANRSMNTAKLIGLAGALIIFVVIAITRQFKLSSMLAFAIGGGFFLYVIANMTSLGNTMGDTIDLNSSQTKQVNSSNQQP